MEWFVKIVGMDGDVKFWIGGFGVIIGLIFVGVYCF